MEDRFGPRSTTFIHIEPGYFIPSIEDIRVGYEYYKEILDYSCQGEGCKPLGYTKEIFGLDVDLDLRDGHLPKLPHPAFMRVPYLTKEQIEAEGWEKNCCLENEDYECCSFKKGTYECRTWVNEKDYIEFYNSRTKDDLIYEGACKDINTFRIICKLLGI